MGLMRMAVWRQLGLEAVCTRQASAWAKAQWPAGWSLHSLCASAAKHAGRPAEGQAGPAQLSSAAVLPRLHCNDSRLVQAASHRRSGFCMCSLHLQQQQALQCSLAPSMCAQRHPGWRPPLRCEMQQQQPALEHDMAFDDIVST